MSVYIFLRHNDFSADGHNRTYGEGWGSEGYLIGLVIEGAFWLVILIFLLGER